MPKKNPPDATRKEVAELRKRIVALERAVTKLVRGLARMMS
jgi:hypothetical protein